VGAAAYRSAEKLYSNTINNAAYRSGEQLHNEQSRITHDYTRKKGVVYTEITIPEHAPKEYLDRQTLWNSVESAEKQHNAQTAREIVVALPVELNQQEQIELLRGYIKQNFIDVGMCADFAIHDKGDGNPHAHIMLTMRPINKDGSWGAKSRKEYILDRNGEKIKLKSGNWKSRRVDSTNWDKKETLLKWRENWARVCNAKFQEKWLNIRIDHRSFVARNIDKEPLISIGVCAWNLEKNGTKTRLGDINRAIIARNQAKDLHSLKHEYYIIDKEITELQDLTSEAGREMSVIISQAKEIAGRVNELENMGGIREKFIDYFEQKYNILPEQAGKIISELRRKSQSKQNFQEVLKNKLAPLIEARENIEFEYKKCRLFADISHSRQIVYDELERLSGENQRQSVISLINSAKLDSISKRHFQEILQIATPEQRKVLIEWQERAREKERERLQGRF